MSNFIRRNRLAELEMATKQSRFEIGHLTVVPTNYRREDGSDTADEDSDGRSDE